MKPGTPLMISATHGSATRLKPANILERNCVERAMPAAAGGDGPGAAGGGSPAGKVARKIREEWESYKNAGFSRFPFQRMQRLHQMLCANRYPNCRKVAAEFEVSPKTIHRDLNFMRDRLLLPIEYSDRHFGYYYNRPVDRMIDEETGRPARDGAERAAGDNSPIVMSIHFDAQVADAVAKMQWAGQQPLTHNADGSMEIVLELKSMSGLAAVASWLGRTCLGSAIISPPAEV